MTVSSVAARAAMSITPRPASLGLKMQGRFGRRVTSLCTCSSSSISRKLALYSKPACCLCDGLKEKLQAAFTLSGPYSINDVELHSLGLTLSGPYYY